MASSVGSGFVDPFMRTIKGYENSVASFQNEIANAAFSDRDYNAMREDTAYQRLRADLEAAGLNKWLAVNGSATPSSQAISNTSEAYSRAHEIGFKYQQLLNSALEFAEKQIQSGGQFMFDKVWKLVEKGFGFALMA